ncbi:MAG: UxaA family hydrolase [Oscillospiraceae bacterium]|nr:UxaA family hydrolase [Oscillospiraceae bacterium]
MEVRLALWVNDKDNVATVFCNDAAGGTELTLRSKSGAGEQITAADSIPYGHKIAVRDIRKGEHIIKYGESIGAASTDIRRGDYVHVHNMEALRGRGDL